MSTPGTPRPEDLAAWVGRSRTVVDVIAPGPARALAATLDRDPDALEPGAGLPPAWHWLYFHEATPRSSLGADGHEALGAFLPPLAGARRMWAGGTLRFPGILRIGDEAERRSTIRSVVPKEGRSGPLVFVTVEHRISTSAGVVLEEEQSLVYRVRPSAAGASRPGPPGPTPPSEAPEWTESFAADEVTLFRFSALTFNAHRIHYDHPYATAVEGYAGLLVHGPLIALLLLDAGARRAGGSRAPGHGPAATPAAPQLAIPSTAGLDRFGYRAVAPLFCGEEILLCGRALRAERLPEAAPTPPRAGAAMELWAAHAERGVATRAELRLGGGP